MGKYFGTDGFRGEANVKLTVDHAFKVGRYVGWYYGRDHKAKIVIGKDTRRSSYMFEYALVAGLTASGADVYLLHKVCPLTFVKAKVAIEELEDGEILAVRMNDGEPVQNVPRSMKEEGHKVLKLTDNEDGTYTMYVRKVED